MSYEPQEIYLKIFDRTQSPAYMDWLAARYGVSAGAKQKTDEGNKQAQEHARVYLDMGCAAGHTILALAPLYPQINFIGLDFNTTHIAQANTEAERLKLSNTRFICADFRHLPALPQADYIVVRGIYSWLSSEVKDALDLALSNLAAPGALIKLHYSVRPGALVRESIGHLLQGLPGERTPAEGRAMMELLTSDAEVWQKQFTPVTEILKNMTSERDEMWWHDFLNEDFKAECAHDVINRLQSKGIKYVAATAMERNLTKVLVTDKVAQFAEGLPAARAQTLFDHVTSNSSRDDLFVREPVQLSSPEFDTELRYGLVQPALKLSLPHQTVHGQIRYQNPDCLQLVEALARKPLNYQQLLQAVPTMAQSTVNFWLDMLMAGGKIGPFLSEAQAGSADRERLRRINRARLKMAIESFGHKTQTPLLAAEYGNCLVAGWFESLVLYYFRQRKQSACWKTMLQHIHKARMGFPGPDGKPAPNQLAAFKHELDKLEESYLARMPYWGIEV